MTEKSSEMNEEDIEESPVQIKTSISIDPEVVVNPDRKKIGDYSPDDVTLTDI